MFLSFFYRLKFECNLSVSTWRSGTSICSLICGKQHGTFVWNVLLFAGSGNIFQNKIRLNLPTLHYLIDSNPLKGKSPQFWLIFIENLTAGICLLSNPNCELWQKRAAIFMKSYLNVNFPTTIKVQILWVYHKIWKYLPHYLVRSKWAIFSNFYGLLRIYEL